MNRFGGIGPFLKENGEQVEESEAEVLRKTYEKAYSKPDIRAKILNSHDFFADTPSDIKIDMIPMT